MVIGFRGLPKKFRLYSVALSIGAGSMFMTSLDTVVDNLQPIGRQFLVEKYGSTELADTLWGSMVASRVYGIACGCFLALFFTHLRKWPIVFAFLLTFFGATLSTLIMHNIAVAIFGRFLTGVGFGLAQVFGSSMLAEIPPTSLRGTVLSTQIVSACLGELTGMFISLDTVLGSESTWNFAFFAPTLILPVALIIILMAPDSPRALMIRGEGEEALQALYFYQSSEHWKASIHELQAEQIGGGTSASVDELASKLKDDERNEMCSVEPNIQSIVERFKSGKFVRPLLLGMFVLTLIHLDDWLWISYSTQAFENSGLTTQAATRASLLMVVPQAFLTIFLTYHFDRFSRRMFLIIPTLGSVLCSGCIVLSSNWRNEGLSAYQAIDGEQRQLRDVAYASASNSHHRSSLMIPTIATFDLCLAAVASESAYTIVPELLSQNDRIVGIAIIGISQNLFGAFLSGKILSTLNKYGIEAVLIPLAYLNLIYIIVLTKMLPETGGVSFAEISKNFNEQLPAIFTFTRRNAFVPLLNPRDPLLGGSSNLCFRFLYLFCLLLLTLSLLFYFFTFMF